MNCYLISLASVYKICLFHAVLALCSGCFIFLTFTWDCSYDRTEQNLLWAGDRSRFL